jgi:hypothetical protein
MREIVPGKLWLGNSGDLRHADQILQSGVYAVVDLAIEQWMPMLPRTFMYCRFPIADGEQDFPEFLRVAVETLVLFLQQEIPTLVCCSAGMSRSPAVAAAALSIVRNANPDDELREIAIGHAHDVSPQLWQDVCRICAEVKQKKPS